MLRWNIFSILKVSFVGKGSEALKHENLFQTLPHECSGLLLHSSDMFDISSWRSWRLQARCTIPFFLFWLVFKVKIPECFLLIENLSTPPPSLNSHHSSYIKEKIFITFYSFITPLRSDIFLLKGQAVLFRSKFLDHFHLEILSKVWRNHEKYTLKLQTFSGSLRPQTPQLCRKYVNKNRPQLAMRTEINVSKYFFIRYKIRFNDWKFSW